MGRVTSRPDPSHLDRHVEDHAAPRRAYSRSVNLEHDRGLSSVLASFVDLLAEEQAESAGLPDTGVVSGWLVAAAILPIVLRKHDVSGAEVAAAQRYTARLLSDSFGMLNPGHKVRPGPSLTIESAALCEQVARTAIALWTPLHQALEAEPWRLLTVAETELAIGIVAARRREAAAAPRSRPSGLTLGDLARAAA
jgi:hypothetical protein